MMSKYAGENQYDYTPPSSPRGRRYILRNLNTRRLEALSQKETSSSPRNNVFKEYHDIRNAPSSQSSTLSKRSSHIGTSNRIMPTEHEGSNGPKGGVSPRKTPRQAPVYVSPRKDNLEAKNSSKNNVNKSNQSSPRKPKQEHSNKDTGTKTENGLTPRDSYMVNKLYDKQIIYLKPSEVRYTHDQITAHFNDGRSMLSTFIALMYGRVEIRLGGNDVPPIEVMQVEETEGKLWYVVNGNRRLFILRKLERCGAITTMQVIARKYDSIEMDKHFLTRTKGRTISVINDATLEAKFGNEVKRWKEWKAKQPKDSQGNKKGNAKSKKPNAQAGGSSCCTIS